MMSLRTVTRQFLHLAVRNSHVPATQQRRHYSLPGEFLSVLENELGENKVSLNESVRQNHGKDESYYKCQPPACVVFPENTQDVSLIATLCHRYSVPVIPFGAGTGLEGGVVDTTGGAVCIDMKRMDQIEGVFPEDFDVIVQAGVTREGLNSFLRDTGLWFPIDPGSNATLCGMAATSASGTNAVRYRTMRENVTNLEVVLADGTIMHTAGEGRRTRKTSAGYNLTNLFVGSEGTLGIITKATLRLSGIPESMISAVCQFPTIQAAVDSTVMVLQSGVPIARMELLDEHQISACNKYSGLNYEEKPTVFFEFHGSKLGIQEQVLTVKEIATINDGSDFLWASDMEERNKLWKARYDAWYAAKALRPGCKALSSDVCVPVSHLPEVVVKTQQDMKQQNVTGTLVGHVGDGNFHVLILWDENDPEEKKRAMGVKERISERALALNGTCTGEHGIGLGKRHLLEKEIGITGLEVMKQLKRTLDPKNLMNPGKVLFQES